MVIIIGVLLTYPVSLLINLDHIKDIIKDATNEGYLINIKYFKEQKEDKNKNNNIEKYYKYIPFVNIFDSLINDLEYKFDRENNFEMLRITGAFVNMTKEEEEKFKEKPTILRALNLSSIKEKEYQNMVDNIKKNNVNTSDNIVKEIVKLDKELNEHAIIKEKDNKEEKISIDELINSMNKEELIETLKVFKEYENLYDEKPDGEYIIDSNKKRVLKLHFKNRGE